MADMLSIAVETLSRWETGAQIQQRPFDRALRAFFAVPEFREFLGSSQFATDAANNQSSSSNVASV